MFVWLKMHENAASISETCFVAFFFSLKAKISKTKLAYGERIKTNKPFEKSSYLILAVWEEMPSV